ncbi:hypothetical protein GIB67_002442 [Kingdonia uniflora]|uniref:Uncharacterized protein n=1 Tax=Kingdonia uniflora TaxID=39325 RepID=A0A7J7LWB4_9MAGN|nr:hypothetical protein GIB67_036662 [Kingdonia uniflora]KAF6165620.1 hypothetical protein GIB67_002442 [Kingdonia uniflora]
MAICVDDFAQDNAGSDSDSNSDDSPDYYQPISAVDSDEETQSDENPNGYVAAEIGISNIHLKEEEDYGDEEAERVRLELAVSKAFRDDERRRNAPLPPENATRILDAMRGISLVVPDWSGRVSEDQWVDQLRRLRQQPTATETNNATTQN